MTFHLPYCCALGSESNAAPTAAWMGCKYELFLDSCIVASERFFLFQRTGSTSIQNAAMAGGHIMGSATGCCLKQMGPGRSPLRPVTLRGQTSRASALSPRWKRFSTFWPSVRTLSAKICLFLEALGFGHHCFAPCRFWGEYGVLDWPLETGIFACRGVV